MDAPEHVGMIIFIEQGETFRMQDPMTLTHKRGSNTKEDTMV